MSYTYTVSVEINTSELLPSAAEIENSLNTSMHEFGYHEKIVICTIIPFTVISNRMLTPEEKIKLETCVLKSALEQWPSAHIKNVVEQS